ncbi:uncharacterized protein BJ212DRAFT_1300901 [Suillus subaureus]|uniref:Uncharacterized protein n=1 Tax=Suillus subaureus TaxID=48587 RepID=A0A9P7E8Q7_9AGAM|nr:uncharacterized protein BJ212DRAFT_1300901 [Suillus subaureus]KAG1814047.1 hypothetical protein BJ212DRAFT_1300901 [Suillus subaureus]
MAALLQHLEKQLSCPKQKLPMISMLQRLQSGLPKIFKLVIKAPPTACKVLFLALFYLCLCLTTAKEHELKMIILMMQNPMMPVTNAGPSCKDKTHDIDQFFGNPFECAGTNGTVKKHCKCKVCLSNGSLLLHYQSDIKTEKEKAAQAQQTTNVHMVE